MVTSPYEWAILEWDDKPPNKQQQQKWMQLIHNITSRLIFHSLNEKKNFNIFFGENNISIFKIFFYFIKLLHSVLSVYIFYFGSKRNRYLIWYTTALGMPVY